MAPITKEVERIREETLRKEAGLHEPLTRTTEQSLQVIASVTERIRNNSKLFLVVDSDQTPPAKG